MTNDNETDLAQFVARYSRGKISREQLACALGREVTFSDTVHLLRRFGLPWPAAPSDGERRAWYT